MYAPMKPWVESARTMAVCLLALLCAGTMSNAFAAQDYPNKLIKVIVPFAAGGSTDVLARMVAKRLQDVYGQPVVVENMPGASTQIGTKAVVRADPDGYTLLMATSSLVNNEHLYDKLPYDASKDLVPVVGVVNVPAFLAVGPSIKAKNVKEFLEEIKAKARSEKGLTFGSAGMGSSLHLISEWLLSQLHLKAVHSAYKGTGPASIALAQGEVDFSFDNIAALQPMIDAGKVRILMIAGQQRFPGLMNLPTLKEAGLPDEELSSRFFLVAPAKTPANVINSLNVEINKILAQDDMRTWLTAQGLVPLGGSVDELKQRLKMDFDMWGEVIKNANISLK